MKMDSKNKDYFASWSKRQEFYDLVTKTNELLKDLFDMFERPSLSFSGGKDSMVLLDLCLKHKPDIYVWHWDYGIFMPREIEYNIQSILITEFRVENLTIDTRKSQDKNSSVGYHEFFLSLSKYIKKNRIDLSLIGLRSEESRARKKRCKQIIELDKSTKIANAFPLHNWTWRDIWSYVIINNLPYLNQYDKKASLFGSYEKIRFVTFFDPEFESLGSIEQDKFLFYNKT